MSSSGSKSGRESSEGSSTRRDDDARTRGARSPAGSSSDEWVTAGETLGRYRIDRLVGVGGMGSVYLAFDVELRREVALKAVRMGSDRAAQTEARTRREAQAMAQLSHPNVVPVYGVHKHRGRLVIAMEYVRGTTLSRWMKTSHPWREVVATFIAAGRGLAAAHQAGLVHRDFKPSNVIVGDDGRVRVMDFGLARAPTSPSSSGEEADAVTFIGHDELTEAGTVLGTPAYMPPEQHIGGAVDALSDQYAFCVSLWRALYGEHPFVGDDIVAHKKRGPPRQPRSEVPARVHSVVARGLAPEPSARWPSTADLIAALERAQGGRLRRGLVLAAVGLGAVFAIGAVFALMQPEASVGGCADVSTGLAGAWDEDVRARVEAALTSDAKAYGDDAWRYVEDRIDGYVGAWKATFRDACEARHTRGELPPRDFDLTMRCLEDRRGALSALVNAFTAGQGDVDVALRAVQRTADLPPIDTCKDMDRLRADVPPPRDPKVAEDVDRLRARLTRAETLGPGGAADDGLAIVDEVERQAAEVDYPPLHAAILFARGRLLLDDSRIEDGVAALEQAHVAAVEAGDDRLAARSALNMVYALAWQSSDAREADRWLREARVRVERLGIDDQWREQLAGSEAVIARARGRVEEAVEAERRALTFAERATPPNDLDVAKRLANLGSAEFALGRFEDAHGRFERASRLLEASLGPEHPYVGDLLTSLANTTWQQDRHEEAIALHRRSLAIKQAALGPDHIDVTIPMSNLAEALSRTGQHAEAERHLRHALSIREASLGADNPRVAQTVLMLAAMLERKGDLEAAGIEYQKAIDALVRFSGPDHPDVQKAHGSLARMLIDHGLHDEARKHLRACIGDDPPSGASAPEHVQSCATSLAELEPEQPGHTTATGG